jgi:hypothetical protein
MWRSVSAGASVLGQCWPESYVAGDVTASCISFCPITVVFNYFQVIFLVLTSTSDEFGSVDQHIESAAEKFLFAFGHGVAALSCPGKAVIT